MGFVDLNNIAIKQIDTLVDVVSKGNGTHEADQVMVSSSLELIGDIDSDEALLLMPMAGESQQHPIVRYTDEHVKDGVVFKFDDVERSVYDTELVDRLAELADGTSKKEQREVATQLGRCADGLSAAVVRVKPGQRKLRLFYEIAAPRVDERTFEFSIVGPLPSFVISAGGSISLLSVLPRATTVDSAVGLADSTNPGSEITGKAECDVAGRHVIGWFWQSDPLFRIRYRY